MSTNLFHPTIPNLQVKWDASSLKPLMACPRRYQLGALEGWGTLDQKVDLEFGRIIGEGWEIYELGGATDSALRAAIKHVLTRSHGGFGFYEDAWRCLGQTKFKNAKGNAAKCPYSHAGKWFVAPGPETCSCGSATETANRWLPINPSKDRGQLIRALVWYAMEYADNALIVAKDALGKPMVEHHWELPLGEVDGVAFTICGNLDRVLEAGEHGPVYVADYKTTGKGLTKSYFASWAPDIQVDLYDFAALDFLPAHLRSRYDGVMIDAVQVQPGKALFGRSIYKNDAKGHAELRRELEHYMRMAKKYAEDNYWPMNRTACFLCQFKGVCSQPPDRREQALKAEFDRSFWNPATRERQQERVT